MKLEAVRIKRFRSIEDISLDGIGELNVLIGKNNSGKSNILLAIDTFFACIKTGGLVTTDPPTGRDIDFFGKRTRDPIEIQLTFSIQPPERDRLIESIVSESPQVKNAADAINPAVQIRMRTAAELLRCSINPKLTKRSGKF